VDTSEVIWNQNEQTVSDARVCQLGKIRKRTWVVEVSGCVVGNDVLYGKAGTMR
jgi:hypothetical protein